MPKAITSGPFDDVRSPDIRFLEEASEFGELTVYLWSDEQILAKSGKPPKFPLAERQYFLESLRYVARVEAGAEPALRGDAIRVVRQGDAATPADRIVPLAVLKQLPAPPPCPAHPRSDRKKVLVTGCYDWFHTGHVRFFEEVSELGDLYVVVGHDANIRLLKGEGHPLIGERERCYVAGSVRFARLALVSTGSGWLDAEPEVDRIRPDIYAVNEDGDRPEKAEFCARKGIEYRVLKRLPKPGLSKRSSTDLRGF